MSLEEHILHPRDIMTGDVQWELRFGECPQNQLLWDCCSFADDNKLIEQGRVTTDLCMFQP